MIGTRNQVLFVRLRPYGDVSEDLKVISGMMLYERMVRGDTITVQNIAEKFDITPEALSIWAATDEGF